MYETLLLLNQACSYGCTTQINGRHEYEIREATLHASLTQRRKQICKSLKFEQQLLLVNAKLTNYSEGTLSLKFTSDNMILIRYSGSDVSFGEYKVESTI